MMGGTRSRTPTAGRGLQKLDFYGRKKGKAAPIAKPSKLPKQDSKIKRDCCYPLMDSIALEIRAHLEEAKGEITVLQR